MEEKGLTLWGLVLVTLLQLYTSTLISPIFLLYSLFIYTNYTIYTTSGFVTRDNGLELYSQQNWSSVISVKLGISVWGICLEKETVAQRQSRVARAGGRWEEYVRLFLNETLQKSNIEVIVGKNEKDIRERSKMLWKMLSVPIRASTSNESTWGDIDLVAVKENIPVSVISCKVSLHGRFTETLFWSLLFRTMSRIRVVLATPDGGRASKENTWQSEWGTPDSPTKDRQLAESYLDSVYVENLEEFCKGIKPNEKTAFGGIIRHLAELPEDLLRWGEDSKFIYTKKQLNSFH